MWLVTGIALAASNEVSAEIGWVTTSDVAFNRLSDGDTLGSYGLRAGVKLSENLAAIAGWNHAETGAVITVEDTGEFHNALYTDRFNLGAKFDVRVNEYFHPYLIAQGALLRGMVRIDDDPDDDENEGQVQEGSVTGGFDLALGGEVPVALGTGGKVAVAPYLELGYGWLAPLRFETLGELRIRGFVGRAGFGVRF